MQTWLRPPPLPPPKLDFDLATATKETTYCCDCPYLRRSSRHGLSLPSVSSSAGLSRAAFGFYVRVSNATRRPHLAPSRGLDCEKYDTARVGEGER